MRIAVLGASGGTGRHVAACGRERGHEVRAVVRRAASASPGWQATDVAVADVLDASSVTRALAGCDAAVWAVGGHDVVRTALARQQRQRGLCTEGTRVVLAALRNQRVARFVVISSWGVGDSRRRVPLLFRAFVMPVLLRAELADKQRQEELVRTSDVTWTIVRPSRLTDDDSTSYCVGPQLTYSQIASTSRKSVADFVLRCIDDSSFEFETVEITGARAR